MTEPDPIPTPFGPPDGPPSGLPSRRPRAATWVVFAVVLVAGGYGVVAGLRPKPDRGPDAALITRERDADRKEMAAAFLDPTPPTAYEARQFGPLFDRLGDALARGDAAAAGWCFDFDRYLRELERIGAFNRFDERDRPTRAAFGPDPGGETGRGLVKNFAARWDRTTLRRVRWSTDRKEAVVIAVHAPTDPAAGVPVKLRWWLVGGGGEWRVYDVEDLDSGWRYTTFVSAILAPELVNNWDRVRRAMEAIRDATAALQRGDAAAAEKALDGATADGLPAPVVARVEATRGAVLLEQGTPAEALARFDAAERLNPDMPMLHALRAAAHGKLGEYDKSLAAARRYTALLGSDPVARFWEGYALEALGQPAEAAAAYRAALDDDPNFTDALHGLRRVLPPADKGELADRLAKAADPKAMYDALIVEARKDDDREGTTALLAGLRKAQPNNPTALAEDIRLTVAAGRFPEADRLLGAGLALPPGGREVVRDAFLYAMANAGKAVDAYAAMPASEAAAAFRLLAAAVDDDEDEVDPTADGKGGDALRGLIAAYRGRGADDPWLAYYEASLLQQAKDWAGAERRFAEGATLLAKRPVTDAGDSGAFRRRRVECLYRLGKGIEAYRTVGPARDTFEQLAWRYHGDAKWDDLSGLVDAHETADRADPAVAFWRGQVAFAREEYPAAVEAYQRYRKAARADAPFVWTADVQLVRALLRSGRAADAKWELGLLEEAKTVVPVALRAAVRAATGDVDGVDRLMAEGDRGWGSAMFYHDPDFARAVAVPRFDPIRRKYPPPAADKPGT